MSETMKNDGGPAFPQHDLSGYGMGPAMRGYVPGEDESGRYEVEGMSLRDWFAGQALLAAWEVAMTYRPPDDAQRPEEYCAVQAYAIADAMLAERKK